MPYVTLEENRDWLKPVGTFEEDSDDGMTQEDVTRAEDEAMVYTDAKIGWMYDTTDWEDSTPPIVELANKYIASAIVIDYFLSRSVDVTVGEQYMPDKLWERGEALLNRIIDGSLEVTDTAGDLIERQRIAPRKAPQTSASKVTFFPERSSDSSYGKLPRFSAEQVYKRI